VTNLAGVVSGYDELEAGTSLSVTVTGLTESTPHWYVVRAQNATGWGEWSDRVRATTLSEGAIVLNTTQLVYSVAHGRGDPAIQYFAVSNSGYAAFTYMNVVAYGAGASGWFNTTLGGTLNAGQQLFNVGMVGVGSLPVGTYYATNTVTSGTATNSPVLLPIVLHITPGDITNAPVNVPVVWLDEYGLTNDQEQAVLEDPDGDGAATWQEYVMDTNPTNGLSVLYLDNLSIDSASQLLEWPGSSNRIYTMYYNTNVFMPLTNILFENYQPGQSGGQSWTDSVQGVHRSVNYRVKVALPDE
jgi:hypothetical protein